MEPPENQAYNPHLIAFKSQGNRRHEYVKIIYNV